MSLGMAVIGLGRWGPNYMRILGSLKGVDLIAAVDLNEEQLDRFRQMDERLINAHTLGIVALDAPTGGNARVVARLEAGMEMFLDPDDKPWIEFDWIGRDIRIGDCVLKVRERTDR